MGVCTSMPPKRSVNAGPGPRCAISTEAISSYQSPCRSSSYNRSRRASTERAATHSQARSVVSASVCMGRLRAGCWVYIREIISDHVLVALWYVVATQGVACLLLVLAVYLVIRHLGGT